MIKRCGLVRPHIAGRAPIVREVKLNMRRCARVREVLLQKSRSALEASSCEPQWSSSNRFSVARMLLLRRVGGKGRSERSHQQPHHKHCENCSHADDGAPKLHALDCVACQRSDERPFALSVSSLNRYRSL